MIIKKLKLIEINQKIFFTISDSDLQFFSID
jgi:hypothetical protein